jgi:pimeloyl-ACP methyl ester carboxylesterase
MRAKFIDVDGINTRYLYEGEGNETALLLIHGGGVAADTWLRNIDELGKEFAVYAPDNIGHGFTDAINLGADLPQPHTTHHLIRFMETIGVDKYSVGGSSYGALIAGLVYFDAPDRIDKLIFVGSSSVFDTDENYRKALQGAYDNAAKTIGNPDFADCRRRLNNAVHDPASVPDEVLIMQLTQYAQPDRVEFYVAANRNRVDAKGPIGSRIVDKIEEIKVPTLVITGKQDKRTNWENTELTAKRIPDARCVTIDQCGHLPYIEHPQAFNDLVADFLRS